MLHCSEAIFHIAYCFSYLKGSFLQNISFEQVIETCSLLIPRTPRRQKRQRFFPFKTNNMCHKVPVWEIKYKLMGSSWSVVRLKMTLKSLWSSVNVSLRCSVQGLSTSPFSKCCMDISKLGKSGHNP